MKRFLTVFFSAVLCLTMVFSLSACGGEVKEIQGTLEEIMGKIYSGADIEQKPFVYNSNIKDEMKEYYLGSSEVQFVEGIASEGMISVAHSIVLIRVEKGSNINATKKLIKDNVNPFKWICVGVDDKDVIVDNIGHLIVLIMSKDSAAYHASFKELATEVQGTLEDIMEKIYNNADIANPIAVFNSSIEDDRKEYYLGSKEVEFVDGIASEGMFSTSAHSIVLIRVEKGSNINATKKLIKDNVNPFKWICVGVDAKDVIVDNIGHLIVLIMSKDSAAYHASFKALANV